MLTVINIYRLHLPPAQRWHSYLDPSPASAQHITYRYTYLYIVGWIHVRTPTTPRPVIYRIIRRASDSPREPRGDASSELVDVCLRRRFHINYWTQRRLSLCSIINMKSATLLLPGTAPGNQWCHHPRWQDLRVTNSRIPVKLTQAPEPPLGRGCLHTAVKWWCDPMTQRLQHSQHEMNNWT